MPPQELTYGDWNTDTATSTNVDIQGDTFTLDFAVPDSGVSRWEFEQDVTDSWGNNDGTNNGATFTTDSQVGSYALSFGGTDDYVSLPSGLFSTSGFSMAIWLYATGVSGDRDTAVTFKADVDSDLRSTSGSSWQFGLYDGSNFNTCTAPYSADAWQHIVCTYDGSVAEIYKDGSPVDSVSTGLVTDSRSSYIGTTADVSSFYNGRGDDPRVYDKGLIDSEVSNLHSTGSING